MKINFKNPYVRWGSILAGVALLIWGGFALWNVAVKTTLEKELTRVNGLLQNTSARINPSEHIELLGRRNKIEELLKKY